MSTDSSPMLVLFVSKYEVMIDRLFEKYDRPTPRYTSYPSLPDWQKSAPTQVEWFDHVNQQLASNPLVSLYIHLPFCEALCTYCACNKRITKNHGVESPYIDTVIKEWQLYLDKFTKRPIIDELHLGGGTPTFFSPQELDRMLQAILSSCEISSAPKLAFEAHPNSTTRDHLTVLYKHGFKRISIGVQDVSQKVMTAINRHQTVDQIKSLTEHARELGYNSVSYDIIYGLPFQGISEIEETMKFIAQSKPDRLSFYSYAHVPWKSKGQRAFTEQDLTYGLEKQALRERGDELLKAQGYNPIGMDHYALAADSIYQAQKAKSLHRNFMGFTEQKTHCLIGLGNSSISDSQSMYVQNEKTVEAYQESINAQVLPIIKGHAMTPREQKIRDHIINLSCYGEANWDGSQMDEDILVPSLLSLIELENEGIIHLSENGIEITDIGLPFVRNVCAAIDPYFSLKSESIRFSRAI